MKIRTAIAAAFAIAVGLGAGPAHAVCTDLSLRSLADVGFYGADQYHVFAATETGQVIGFDVRHSNKDDPCDYFVTFSRGDSLTYDRRMTYAANELHYQIYDGPAKANVLKDIGDGCGAETARVVELINSMKMYWTPGIQGNSRVRVQYTLPVEFESN